MKFLGLASSLVVMSGACFATGGGQRDMSQGMSSSKMSQQKQQQNQQMMQMNTAPAARPQPQNGCGLEISGEALLWKMAEDNIYYALHGGGEPGMSIPAHLEIDPRRVDPDWSWGCRIGADYTFHRDQWDLDLVWTHMKNTGRKSAHDPNVATTPQIMQVWGTPSNGQLLGESTPFAKGSLKVNLDQVDLRLGREFFVGRHLTLRPNIGARSTFIFQKFHSLVEGISGDTNDTHLKNQFWGLGFVAGMDTNWCLGQGFSLFGDAAFSVLFGYFKIHEKGVINSTVISKWSSNDSFHTAKPVFDVAMGLKWFRAFCDEQLGLTLKVAYEYHVYVNQNQWQQPTGNPNMITLSATPGDLGYQGLSFGAALSF